MDKVFVISNQHPDYSDNILIEEVICVCESLQIAEQKVINLYNKIINANKGHVICKYERETIVEYDGVCYKFYLDNNELINDRYVIKPFQFFHH